MLDVSDELSFRVVCINNNVVSAVPPEMVPQTSPLRGLPVASTRLIPEDLEGIALNSVEGASISQLDLLAECPIESAVSFSLSYEASTLWLISMV